MNHKARATLFALLAAALYALNSPVSKLLLNRIPPTIMAGFLYLGAGIGIFLFGRIRTILGNEYVESPPDQKRTALYNRHDRS